MNMFGSVIRLLFWKVMCIRFGSLFLVVFDIVLVERFLLFWNSKFFRELNLFKDGRVFKFVL